MKSEPYWLEDFIEDLKRDSGWNGAPQTVRVWVPEALHIEHDPAAKSIDFIGLSDD